VWSHRLDSYPGICSLLVQELDCRANTLKIIHERPGILFLVQVKEQIVQALYSLYSLDRFSQQIQEETLAEPSNDIKNISRPVTISPFPTPLIEDVWERKERL